MYALYEDNRITADVRSQCDKKCKKYGETSPPTLSPACYASLHGEGRKARRRANPAKLRGAAAKDYVIVSE